MAPVIMVASKFLLVNSIAILLSSLREELEEGLEPIRKIPLFNAMESLNPGNHSLLVQRAWLHFDVGQYSQALRYIDSAIEKNSCALYLKQKALMLWELHNTDSAIEYIDSLSYEQKREMQDFIENLHFWKNRQSTPNNLLASYLEKKGAEVRQLMWAKNSHLHYGVFAGCRTRYHRFLYEIPLKFCIYDRMKNLNPEIKLLASIEQLHPVILLTVVLMIELESPKSEHNLYLKSINWDERHSPLLFSQHELSMLSGTQVLNDIIQESSLIEDIYNEIYPEISIIRHYSYEDFRRIYAYVRTHAAKIEVNGQSIVVLVPLLDSIPNYPSFQANVQLRYDPNFRTIQLEAKENINIGSITSLREQ